MSNTWKLVNESGDPEFGITPMDIVLTPEGSFEELEGQDVLDQRVRKSVVQKKGADELAPDFGSTIRDRLGSKGTERQQGLSIGSVLSEMVENLKRSQEDAKRRIGTVLLPEELLIGAEKFQVVHEQEQVQVNAVLNTEALNIDTSTTVVT